jgi:hypothetical protein
MCLNLRCTNNFKQIFKLSPIEANLWLGGGRSKSSRGPHLARGPPVGHRWSRQFGSLNVSQPYGSPRPVTGDSFTLLFIRWYTHTHCLKYFILPLWLNPLYFPSILLNQITFLITSFVYLSSFPPLFGLSRLYVLLPLELWRRGEMTLKLLSKVDLAVTELDVACFNERINVRMV